MAEVVGRKKRKMEDPKLNHQFKEENVPEIFRTLINQLIAVGQLTGETEVSLDFYDSYCTIQFDETKTIRWEKAGNDWQIRYENGTETVKVDDPEKSIVDHLWFLLKYPDLYLTIFSIIDCSEQENAPLNFVKFEMLLPSMLESIDHQLQIGDFQQLGLNEDTFSLMLQRITPGTLGFILFIISWKEDGNYEKMKEIVKMDQWKQARSIDSAGITPLKIGDLFHCRKIWMKVEKITPEDVRSVRDHKIDNEKAEKCELESNESIIFNEIEKVLPPNSTREEKNDEGLGRQIVYTHLIPNENANSPNRLTVVLSEKKVNFKRHV